jgi:hypothetical protein
MSELYRTSETSDAEPVPDTPEPDDVSSQQSEQPAQADDLTEYEETLEGDDYYDDASTLATEEEGLSTRQEAREQTWGDNPEYYNEDDLADAYDGDANSLAAEEEGLPTRQEAREEAWGDNPEDNNENELAAGYNSDAGTLAAEEEGLPTRQEAWQEAWGDSGTQPSAELERAGEGEDVTSPGQTQLIVHDQEGRDVPITVVRLASEDRTLGDDAPDGVGLKPTGEQLFHMETNDPEKNRMDRFFDATFERMDDIHDATSDLSHAIQEDLPRGPAQPPSTGHIGYVVHDQPTPPPDSSGSADMVANLTVVGVVTAVGIRHLMNAHRKGRHA